MDKVPGLPSDGSQTASNHTCSVSPPTTAADRGYIPMIHLSMEGQEITTLIDSGSHISVITEACHQSIPALRTRALNKTFILASGVMGHPLDMQWCFVQQVSPIDMTSVLSDRPVVLTGVFPW